jgi:hypothetical protein
LVCPQFQNQFAFRTQSHSGTPDTHGGMSAKSTRCQIMMSLKILLAADTP